MSSRERIQPLRPPAPLERLDVMWRAMGLSGVIWECVWYRREGGFEFRVQRSDDEDDVIAIRAFSAIDEEMQICVNQWLSVATAKGFIKLAD